MITITSPFSSWERGENEIPISRQFFSSFLFCSLNCDQLLMIKVEVSSQVLATWRYPFSDLHRYANVPGYNWVVQTCNINWCVCVHACGCVHSLPLFSLLLYLGHCFCFLCSSSDGYVLYSQADAYAAWAQLFMMLQAVCECYTEFTIRGYISLWRWLMYFYVLNVYFLLFVSSVFPELLMCVLCLTYKSSSSIQ